MWKGSRRASPAGLVGWLCLACGGAEPGAVGHDTAVRDSAGVRIVTNQDASGHLLEWTFERLTDLGEDAGAGQFGPLEPRGVAVDRDGSVFVLDRQNHRVVVFDSTGRAGLIFGGEGDGPGELRSPRTMAVDPDGGRVRILDYARAGFVVFSGEGQYVGIEDLRGLAYTGERVEGTALGVLLTVREGARSEQDSLAEALIRKVPGMDPQPIVSVPRPNPPYVEYTGCVSIGLDPIFAHKMSWDASDDVIVVNSGPEYGLELLDSRGQLKARFEISGPPRPVTEALARAEIEPITVRTPHGSCTIGVDELLEGRGLAEWVPAIEDVVLLPTGEVWVARYRLSGEPLRVDVFTSDGVRLGEVQPPVFPIAFMDETRFVALERDSYDVDHVVMYRVERMDP